MLSIKPIKAFSDNYIWLVSTNEGSIVVDPGEADQVLNLCESNGIDLKGILKIIEEDLKAILMKGALK